MSRGFSSAKRRVESAKRQKRELKRLKRLNKGAIPEQPIFTELPTDISAEPPALEAGQET